MKYICYRYGVRHEWPVETIDEAIQSAWQDFESGEAQYHSVIDDHGNEILGLDALREKVFALDEAGQ